MPLDSWKPLELQNGNSIILRAKAASSTKKKLEDRFSYEDIFVSTLHFEQFNHSKKMDALFEGLVDRLRTSGRLADSTLLEIVHSAMLDAHKKTVSEEKLGLVRLHHNARFHELSIMELECCLKVVREEAENNFSDQRYEFEQVLASISEQQALMQKKLEELEIIIAEKDRDLTRIKHNEFKLAFDVVANEVEKAVKENVKNNCTKRSTVPNLDRENNGMFNELKSSIEQEVSKIEVKLKNERYILADKFNKLKPDSVDGVTDLENDGVKQFHGLYNMAHLLIGFEEMISDVNLLEENIKFSFEMIESSTSLFKTKLEESKLEMDTEREMLNLLMKSYIQEAQCNNCKLDLIGVITAAKTTKLQSTEEILEEAAALREEIDKVVVSSMINEWNNKKNLVDIKYSMRDEIDNVLFGESMKDLTKFCLSSSTLALSKERDHKAAVSLMINDCNANKEAIQIENSLREDIDRFVISEIMKDFIKFSSSTSCRNTENSDDKVQKETIDKKVLQETNTAFTKLSESISDVETMISCRTDANNKRLKNLDQQLDVMKEEIILLKRKELLYRNAFLRRCYDLQTAEAEVDLLGDELEFLLGLIKKSYEVLDHHLPEQKDHSEVAEIVNLLKREVEAELQP